MEHSEFLKAILERVGVTEQEFTEAAAEILAETVDNDLITIMQSGYILTSNWTTNQA